MIVNFNIGFLGHVDSGKTTLARVLSSTSSTAAFDKSSQSQERGITLDLGFSALMMDPPSKMLGLDVNVNQVQFTFVDCPGHASLIRTIIAGAQIIDMMILVIDALKGVQTQTAECIVIGELLCKKLIVVVNKIDLLEQSGRDATLLKLNNKLKKILLKTSFGDEVPIYNISAQTGINVQNLLEGICAHAFIPKRNIDLPLILNVDHCFSVKGQGTVCTGTLTQGKLAVNDMVEISSIRELRKVKSIQMFRRPVLYAEAGDRIGLCVSNFNANLMERGLITKPGYLQPVYAACIGLKRIPYYKFVIKSNSKFHVTVGHETVMAKIIIFRNCESNLNSSFSLNHSYEYVEEIEPNLKFTGKLFALLQFETSILAPSTALLIASKLDMNVNTNCCRLAFWGNIEWFTNSSNYLKELFNFKVFKIKIKDGTIQRVINDREIIVQNLFKMNSNRDIYLGMNVSLSTGEVGIITSAFGQSSKVKIYFSKGISTDTFNMLGNGQSNSVLVQLKYKKYVFDKNAKVFQ